MENPDYKNPEFNTKFGVYSQGCGLEDVLMTWCHDEYMYLVAKENKTTLPQGGMFIIRYHSFYPLHKAGAYTQLMNEVDVENMKWLHILKGYVVGVRKNNWTKYWPLFLPKDRDKLKDYPDLLPPATFNRS